MNSCNSRTNVPATFPSRETDRSAPFGSRAPEGLYLYASTYTCGTSIVVSGTDSDLEAFSHNPADDSFAPLPARTGANTKYLNERFLSY